jgi:hypothetical protein
LMTSLLKSPFELVKSGRNISNQMDDGPKT